MPVTINPVGTVLDVTIVDGNFQSIDDLFKGGMLDADFVGRFDRINVSTYTGGRIVNFSSFQNPWRTAIALRNQEREFFDMTHRAGTEDPAKDSTGVFDDARKTVYTMELLGLPGPSFTYDFQEDGLSDPNVYFPGITGWPPAGSPFTRYPISQCWSRWLTIPHAARKIFVPEQCTAVIRGNAIGSTTYSMAASHKYWFGAPDEPYVEGINKNFGIVRLGLIVDTNPVRYADEFVNANPRLLEEDGSQATRCTWSVVEDRTVAVTQRDKMTLLGKVSLKGNRDYNFRFAYRGPGHHGWVDDQGGGVYVFQTSVWENDGAGVAPPSATGAVYGPYLAGLSWPSGGGAYALASYPFHNPFVCLWESASITIEFYYGRNDVELDNTADPDFDTFLRNPGIL